MLNKLFFEIHNGLPREGPGNYASTLMAYRLMTDLPDQPSILDIGCGPGKQTFDLADISNGTITAVDNHEAYVETIEEKINEFELFDRVSVMKGDMKNLQFPDHNFDLIWSEGAIYIMGFLQGLTGWKKFLKPGGYMAVSEISWLKKDAPPDVKAFWDDGYPEMNNIEENIKIIAQCGYEPIGHFTLPPSAWWDDYYDPIQIKLDEMFERYKDDPEAMEYLMYEQAEIDLYKNYHMFYGYVFYIMRNLNRK